MNLMAIGRFLKQHRENKELGFDEVGAAAGVHPNTVRSVEAGFHDHKLGTFEAIAKVVGVSLVEVVKAGKRRVK